MAADGNGIDTVAVHDLDALAESIAERLGVPWPMTESDLAIGRVSFEDQHPSLEAEDMVIGPSPSNMKSRLFLQGLLAGASEATITADVRGQARAFYGEKLVSETLANPHQHPFIRGFIAPNWAKVKVRPNGLRDLRLVIEAAWDARLTVAADQLEPSVREAIETAVGLLDRGDVRVAEKVGGVWVVNQWLKQACLLFLKYTAAHAVEGEPGINWDKVPLKGRGRSAADWAKAGYRHVPGAVVRYGSHVARSVVLMANCFVSMGAYVDEDTMVDTGARVGSCAQVGKRVHLGAGSGIGGVFEPLQANPTIIGDDVFIGAMSEIAEGVIVGDGAIIGMGTYITASTRIIDRKTGESLPRGIIPPESVVVGGSYADPHIEGLSLNCAVIIKQADLQTRAKTGINELLRD